jgi:hypothetical protein
MLRLPYVRVLPDMSFFRLQNCVRGDFLISQKCPDVLPLSIVTLNFSVVVTYVIVRSSRRHRFNFRTFFTATSGGSERMLAQPGSRRSFWTVCSEVTTCYALFSSCVVSIVFLQWGKENVNSRTNWKASIRVSEMVATSGKLNDWYVNQELMWLWRTRVFLIFECTWKASNTRKPLEVKRVRQQ